MICAYWNNDATRWPQAISRALAAEKPHLVPFESLRGLADLARQTILDLVVVPVGQRRSRAIAIARRAKGIPALVAVPIILWHPNIAVPEALAILDSGVDDLIVGAPDDPVAAARLRLALRRSRRDLDINPSSRLPGPTTIERVVSERLARREQFAVCYADIDDFKAYNDYYGYFYGDRVIKMCARIIRETVLDHQPDGFVGHIGGDDFVFIVDSARVPRVCEAVLKRFDAEKTLCYAPRDRRNGYIISRNRRGTTETYGLMTLSIAVVVNRGDTFSHVGEMSHMVADLKHYTKTLPGSNYMIERRAKY